MNNKIFFLRKVKGDNELYFIDCNVEMLQLNTSSEGLVLPSRLLGLEYKQWLIFCKQNFGAKIMTISDLPCPVFYKDETIRLLVKLLNGRLY